MSRGWKRAKKYTYLIVFVLPVLVVLGVRYGGAAAFLTPFVAFVVIPLLDLIVGEDRVNYAPEEEEAMDGKRYYRLVTYAFVPAYWAVLAYVVRGAIAGGWGAPEYAGNTWSMGILSGIGIVVAHELGHKAGRLEKALARALLHPAFYGHFTEEHNLGHHLMVATPEDPASARFGESFWKFYPRTVTGTFRKSLELERRRLARIGKSVWSLRNETWRNVLFPMALTAGALVAGRWLAPEAPGLFGLGAGATAALVVVVQAILGFSLLEIVNYLEHYGLERRKLPNGRYERVTPLHSWNSNHLVTNGFLYHLQRHSDHHAWPARRYQVLRNFPESPQLPTGYAGMILLAAVPPLWFRVMDCRVLDFRARQARSEAVEGEGIVA
ncbi:MAG TPA: alkane 1-monooxygenase [Thermoanaerobaculia bacterium]|nr:alkane 1-monooxygenase [Thermoanaerobaculia bacterium]HQR67271.1 alkane 1-monooxygenase [Thermoanaerobaculia bacterium]